MGQLITREISAMNPVYETVNYFCKHGADAEIALHNGHLATAAEETRKVIARSDTVVTGVFSR